MIKMSLWKKKLKQCFLKIIIRVATTIAIVFKMMMRRKKKLKVPAVV